MAGKNRDVGGGEEGIHRPAEGRGRRKEKDIERDKRRGRRKRKKGERGKKLWKYFFNFYKS